MSHVCTLLIDNVGNYLYGRFKFEVDPHQFNLRLHHFSQFQRIKKIQKLAGLWLAGEMVDHIGIYGSKVAEGLSAFQHRSCSDIFNMSDAWDSCDLTIWMPIIFSNQSLNKNNFRNITSVTFSKSKFSLTWLMPDVFMSCFWCNFIVTSGMKLKKMRGHK